MVGNDYTIVLRKHHKPLSDDETTILNYIAYTQSTLMRIR